MLCLFWIQPCVCVGGSGVSSCEGVASCSLCCWGHRETQGVFWGHGAATFHTWMFKWEHSLPGLLQPISHLRGFPSVTSPQSFNAPKTLVLIRTASASQLRLYQCLPAEASFIREPEVTGDQLLDPSCSHAAHVVPCYGLVLLLVRKVKCGDCFTTSHNNVQKWTCMMFSRDEEKDKRKCCSAAALPDLIQQTHHTARWSIQGPEGSGWDFNYSVSVEKL